MARHPYCSGSATDMSSRMEEIIYTALVTILLLKKELIGSFINYFKVEATF
jgi:hypothetical protein